MTSPFIKLDRVSVRQPNSFWYTIRILYNILNPQVNKTLVNDIKVRLPQDIFNDDEWFHLMLDPSKVTIKKINKGKKLLVQITIRTISHINKTDIIDIFQSKKVAIFNIQADVKWKSLLAKISIQLSRYE